MYAAQELLWQIQYQIKTKRGRDIIVYDFFLFLFIFVLIFLIFCSALAKTGEQPMAKQNGEFVFNEHTHQDKLLIKEVNSDIDRRTMCFRN